MREQVHFDYTSPSSWGQRALVALLAAVAFFIALYMGLYQWRLIPDAWDPVFFTTKNVLDSDLSHQITYWIGIPDAIFGALAYLSDVVYAMAGSKRRWHDRPWLVILFGLDVIPLGGASAILVVAQGTIVGSWCFLCLITAAISISLIFLVYSEVAASCEYLFEIWKRTKDREVLWDAFWGKPCRCSNEAVHAVIMRRRKYVGKNHRV